MLHLPISDPKAYSRITRLLIGREHAPLRDDVQGCASVSIVLIEIVGPSSWQSHRSKDAKSRSGTNLVSSSAKDHVALFTYTQPGEQL